MRSFEARALVAAGAFMSGVAACGGSEFSAAEPTQGGSSGAPSVGGAAGKGGTGAAGGSGGGTGGSSGGAGGGGGNGGTSDRTLQDACLEYTTATCEWQERCLGQLYYPSVEICVQQTRHFCEAGWYGLGLEGALLSPAHFDACTAITAATDCNRSWPGCTLPAGQLGTGERCQSSYQCASSRCSGSGYTCGTCLPPAGGAGTACVSASDCRPETTCIDGVCLKTSPEGEACGDDAPCAAPSFAETVPDGRLLCVEGTCKIVGRLGEPCYSDATAMDLCGYLTACSSVGTCVPVERATGGERCGVFADVLVTCAVGSCRAEVDGGETVCVPKPGAGEECSPALQNCEWSLTCTTGGRCAWPAAMAVTPCEE